MKIWRIQKVINDINISVFRINHYSAINIRYLVRPSLGVLVWEQTQIVVKIFWLSMVITVGITVDILQYLDRRLMSETHIPHDKM
ncbi:MAG: hypothetical protein F6K54_11785 [Okeania sp. SIO3B5]|uniref:hypothetical protein n=1 Tax=Okeania sp. SIO3B5 TaxID=2607811 RepID=UPI001401803C|nr:hypothetical protein [Okeania sp. SIO3B5]NEO53700.1 hypothetical protein [Okeania sp. SIO3B5]